MTTTTSNRYLYSRTCEICEKEFKGAKGQMTCSRRCMGIRKRKAHEVACTCGTCGKKFSRPAGQVAAGRGRYCSAACYRTRKLPTPPKLKSLMRLWRTGLSARQIDQKLGLPANTSRRWLKRQGLFEPRRHGPNHGRWQGGVHVRTAAPRVRARADNRCERCGYAKYPGILQIHHKDRNRRNNAPKNLELLCPNCHEEEHYLAKDGRY